MKQKMRVQVVDVETGNALFVYRVRTVREAEELLREQLGADYRTRDDITVEVFYE